MSEHTLRPVLREKRDIGPRFMLALLSGIGACLLLMIGVAYLLFSGEMHDQRFAKPFPNFPAPVLQPSPPAAMQRFHAQEMQRLNSAGWIDKATGTVHIPIDQGMRAVVADGIPGWPTGPTGAGKDSRQ
jgi:hypothetical protein